MIPVGDAQELHAVQFKLEFRLYLDTTFLTLSEPAGRAYAPLCSAAVNSRMVWHWILRSADSMQDMYICRNKDCGLEHYMQWMKWGVLAF